MFKQQEHPPTLSQCINSIFAFARPFPNVDNRTRWLSVFTASSGVNRFVLKKHPQTIVSIHIVQYTFHFALILEHIEVVSL